MITWHGPEIDGITQSILNDWIQCPFAAYIKYILGLEEDEGFQPNLCWGDCFHVGLEHLIAGKSIEQSIPPMLKRLKKHPGAPATFTYSLPRMLKLYSTEEMGHSWKTEEIIDTVLQIGHQKIRYRGKKDGRRRKHPEYGNVLAEHKCKGYIDPSQTKRELNQDLQINGYMFLEPDCEWVFYDLIKIPDVQKYGPSIGYGETPKEYVERLYCGPMGSYKGQYPINKNKHNWIHQAPYHIPKEHQEKYWHETIIPLMLRMCQWYDYVTQPSFDYENPKFYNEIFYRMPVRHFSGRKTEKFECPYYSLLIGETNIDDLVPVTSYFSELEDE